MQRFLAVLLLSLLVMASPAQAQEAGANLGLETVLGYGVSFKVVNEVIDVVDAAHDYYQVNGAWPADSTALIRFTQAAAASNAVDFEKYERLGLHTIGADQLQIIFQLSPYDTVLEEEGTEDIPLSIRRAAGAIGMEPIARDSSRVIVHMDELEYSGGPDLRVEGDLGGVEMEFEYVGEQR